MKFELLAQRFEWDDNTSLDWLISCLQGEAIEFVSQQPAYVKTSLHRLLAVLERRFGDHVLPETYRASLYSLKRRSKEELEEYAARTRKMVLKAYPGMEGTELIDKLTVEHMVSGLSDPNLVYDVLTKKPRTVEKAIDLIQWHECCKDSVKKKSVLRQVGTEDLPEVTTEDIDDDVSVRRINGKRFVTEERLNQFGRELKDSIISSIKDLMSQQDKEKAQAKVASDSGRSSPPAGGWKPRPRRPLESVECFYCHDMGHYARDCPKKVGTLSNEAKSTNKVTNDDQNVVVKKSEN